MAPVSNPNGKPAGRRTASAVPIIPAIPFPLMARRHQSTTSKGSPIPRQPVQTPVQSPTTGTTKLVEDDTAKSHNAAINNVPPTPARTAKSSDGSETIDEESSDASGDSAVPSAPASAAGGVPSNDDQLENTVPPPQDTANSDIASVPADDPAFVDSPELRDPNPDLRAVDQVYLRQSDVSPPYAVGPPGGLVAHVVTGFGLARSFTFDYPSGGLPKNINRVPYDGVVGVYAYPLRDYPVTAVRDTLPAPGAQVVALARNNFMQYNLADCVVNFYLKVPAGDQMPVPDLHVPGHRFMLSLSPAMQGWLSQQPAMQVPFHQHQTMPKPVYPMPTYSVTLTDSYLTREALVRAMQYMYGFDLYEPSVNLGKPSTNQTPLMQHLSTIAAGFYLQIPQVIHLGAEAAIHYLAWEDLEEVLAFCLTGATNLNCAVGPEMPATPLPFTRFKYELDDGGESQSRKILIGAMQYIAANFPANFKLDPPTGAEKVRRIPIYVAPTYTEPPTPSTPTSIRGKGHRASASIASNYDPRVFSIRFGDLSPEDNAAGLVDGHGQANGHTAINGASGHVNGTNAGSVESKGDSQQALLCRILMNLPFDLLKFLLESPILCQEAGGISGRDRMALITTILGEREKSRLAAVKAVRGCHIARWDMIMERISQSETPALQPGGDESWDVLGWREGILVPRDDVFPRMFRHWEPVDPNHSPTA